MVNDATAPLTGFNNVKQQNELDMLDAELDGEEEMPDFSDLEVASTPLSGFTAADILADAPSAPTTAPAVADQAAQDELAALMAFAE